MKQNVDQVRLLRAKRGFATRRAELRHAACLDRAGEIAPGDLVLARVVALGHHKGVERPDGRKAQLYTGDEVLLASGARYAPDQFEGAHVARPGPASLLAAGGIAGVARARHERVGRPTQLEVLGVLCDRDDAPINVARYALPPQGLSAPLASARTTPLRPGQVLAVAGGSMNNGKTHAATCLIHGLAAKGLRVAALKATGTGAGGDLFRMTDAGAAFVADFTDCGHASTHGAAPGACEEIAERLLAHAALHADIAVLELADGLMQRETAALLRSLRFRRLVDGVVFAAADAIGALHGTRALEKLGHAVVAATGLFARSPLAMREAAAFGLDRLAMAEQLQDPRWLEARLLPLIGGAPRTAIIEPARPPAPAAAAQTSLRRAVA